MSVTNKAGETYYLVEEYAELTGYHPVYVRKMVRENTIAGCLKRRGIWLIPEKALKSVLDADPFYKGEDLIPKAETLEPEIDFEADLSDEDLTADL